MASDLHCIHTPMNNACRAKGIAHYRKKVKEAEAKLEVRLLITSDCMARVLTVIES